jgi:hypothetical protein
MPLVSKRKGVPLHNINQSYRPVGTFGIEIAASAYGR